MINDQDEVDCSFSDQYQVGEIDLYAEVDEIERGIQHFQSMNVEDEDRVKIIQELRTHFAYIEHVAILTGDSSRFEPEFHQLELMLKEFAMAINTIN